MRVGAVACIHSLQLHSAEMRKFMKQDEEITLLQDIYQNALTGERGTDMLLQKSDDTTFTCILETYTKKYRALKQTAADRLKEYGEKPIDIGLMQTTMMFMGVQMNSLIDKTPSHIASMLIEGSTMGIIKGEKSKNRNPEASKETLQLQEQLIELGQNFINELKKYLQ